VYINRPKIFLGLKCGLINAWSVRKVKYMPSIWEQKIEGYSLFGSIVTSWIRPFSQKCSRTVKFHTDYCSGKGVPIRGAKWYWYISCIDKRWKIYLKMNLLDAWAVCFLKGKPLEFAHFFNKIKIVNFITSPYSTKQFLDQTECILGFLMYQLFECHG
jgi:hypothetical protein